MPSEKGDHQNVARAALVIDALANARETGLRLTDVVDVTGLGSATVHRLLAGLVAHGFVDFDKPRNRYFIGLRMISWTAAAIDRYGLSPFVQPELERVSLATEDTVYMSLRSGFDSVCVDRRVGSFPIKTLTLSVGDRRPLGVGAGSLALLSYQPESFIEEVIASDADRRPARNYDAAAMREMIAATRETGYALNDERLIDGMSGVGVAIRDHSGHAVGAVSVAAISTRLAGENLHRVVGHLTAAASAIETGAQGILGTPLAKRYSARKG